ncbi:MAG: SDR family NAD(P)-dependent oxidoreductase [Anaerolineales bacterium]|nr:SDR family NAD(P)-dependent oxidoreductase [Anaerolineales bacterium]MCW5855625.1 SDR family NAD(P)-dependent oxidoreductase [Anaerolineales bacterium]
MPQTKTTPSRFPAEPPLLRRQRAVIVGASSGIGAALAARLAAEGYRVAVLARNKARLNALCEDINRAHGEARAAAYAHDVTDLKAVPVLFQRLVKDLGGIDLFVYCAGVTLPVKIDEFDSHKDQQMLQTNLAGALAWLGCAAALFQGAGRGQLVGISSVAGDRGRVLNPAYNASKAGLDAYLEGLRNRLTRRGVHVLTVKPGFVDTDQLKGSPRTFGVISPEKAADGIWKALRARQQLVYVPWFWRYIMLVIRLVPSFIFRRLSF